MEQESVAELSRRHQVHANQIYQWKKQLLEKLPQLFESGQEGLVDGADREAELLKKIGELTMEQDFLSDGLEHFR